MFKKIFGTIVLSIVSLNSYALVVVKCNGKSQTCDPKLNVSFYAYSAYNYKINVTTSPQHCSDVRFDIDDGTKIIGSSNFLGAGASTPYYPVPIESDGNQKITLAVQATGRKGGCNTGYLGAWAATVSLKTQAKICENDGYQKGYNSCSSVRVIPKESGSGNTCKAGNPIAIANGLKVQIENDFTGPFNLTRVYNSNLGYWSFSYRQHLILVDENTLLLEHSDGKTFRFTKNASDQWQSDNDVFAKLTAVNENNARWQVIYSDNRTEQFDEEGRLIAIKTLQGQRWTLSHSTNTTTIKNPFKETLVYTLKDDLVEKAVINASKTLQYQYDDKQRLIKFTLVDGSTRQYHYENATFPYHLTGITNEQGVRYATWDYDTQGRGILSEHTDGAEKVTFEYHDDNSTTVTNPLGKKTTYYFSEIEGVNRVTKVEGHASASCAAANRDYTYYDNGLLKSKTDWKGVTTAYQYNDRGLVTRQVVAEGTPQVQVTTTEWHDTFRLPTKMTQQGITTEFTYDEQGRLVQQRQVSSK
ncbi:RHS repeat protein [Zooshikella marina]|uniref:RHS repeat protein n=1 Tax=Zooshikella ganghwensis TaxID=202772 RepID=UPI001BAE7E34|nr:RHS repeat protein [Zooshikella ganghwensis]MBU2709192.1 RHS repeat protein [Zooshikella ganghwensis]